MAADRFTQLQNHLASLPTVPMLRRPTPLDAVPRFSAALGDVSVLIKREDMSGLAFGGNKTRELDYFIGDARARGADVFIAGGGVAQSNHAVQCAAAARRAGMQPVVVLHRYRADEVQGNLLLTRLLGADVRFNDTTDVDSAINQRVALEALMEATAAEYRAKGHTPYVLKSSFHPLGAIGYVDCALELAQQLAARGTKADHVYVTSAGATQVGLVLGAKHLGQPFPVTGIAYTLNTTGLVDRMVDLGNQAAERLGVDTRLEPADIVNYPFGGDGYGIPSPGGLEAIHLLAETEGLFLDPVYSGKGMSGLIAHVRSGRIRPGSTVVFIHSGGIPALFAYHREVLA